MRHATTVYPWGPILVDADDEKTISIVVDLPVTPFDGCPNCGGQLEDCLSLNETYKRCYTCEPRTGDAT